MEFYTHSSDFDILASSIDAKIDIVSLPVIPVPEDTVLKKPTVINTNQDWQINFDLNLNSSSFKLLNSPSINFEVFMEEMGEGDSPPLKLKVPLQIEIEHYKESITVQKNTIKPGIYRIVISITINCIVDENEIHIISGYEDFGIIQIYRE